MPNETPCSVGQVLLIPNEQIYPNPNQPRRVFDRAELVNLAISIRMNGILQPLTVRKTEKGYELVTGERRLRAARLAGMANVPCIVVEVNDLKSAVYSLIENLQRQNLGYFEEAVAIAQLMQEFGLSQEDAARRLGKAPSTVSNKLRLLTLPKRAQQLLRENGLSERHARALLRLEKADVLPVLEKAIAKEWNVAQTESYIDAMLTRQNAPKRKRKRMFSDVRIFANTIQNAYETMKSAGIEAELAQKETEDCYLYEIRIPKIKQTAEN